MYQRRLSLCAALGVLVVASACRAADPQPARPATSFAAVVDQVNRRMVKLYGSGGFQGLASYGSGVLVSPDGYILTVSGPLLDTQDLRVHLYDGRRFHAKVIVQEPELDAALVKIDKVEDLPYFDIARAAKIPLAQPGDWVLGFSNQFHIATHDEPMSAQHGVIQAYSKLHGRRGVFEAPYSGNVYVLDAITNNPGAGGGAVTTRKGELLGIIGKELRNTLTDTWINYAVPVPVLANFVDLARQGKYKVIVREKPPPGKGGYTGIVLVPNVVERTPPYVDAVVPNSPASKAGLRPDDLIVYIDGEQVVSIKAFNEMMSRIQPGAEVTLQVRRAEQLVPVKLVIGQPLSKLSPKTK